MVSTILKPILTSLLGTIKNMLLGFNAAYGEILLAGISILTGFLLYRYFKTKATKTVVIIILSLLVYMIMILA